MEQNKIDEILSDIFQLDPSLKKFEKEIKKMIADILAAKPNVSIDANFENKLKKEIMNKISELKEKGLSQEKSSQAFSFPIHKLAYVAGFAVLVFAVVLSYDSLPKASQTTDSNISRPNSNNLNEENIISEVAQVLQKESFTRTNRAAFGKLSFIASSDLVAKPAASEATSQTLALGMGGDSIMDRSMKIMPPYEYQNFKYVYKGESFNQDLAEVDVYKKTKGSFKGQSLVDFVTRLDFGIIDMSKFGGRAEVFNIGFNQDKEFGYSVNINMADDNVFIYSNWLKWPRPDAGCTDDACFARYRLKINEIPANEEIISIASAFMNEYGIDKNNYGEPIIQDNFRNEYEAATDKASVYLPDEVSVVYPFKINDALTVDESGNPTGLYISVNVRHKKVSGVNSLSPRNFEVSAYEAITDNAKLISLAEQGGVYPAYYNNEATKTVEISLGTPSIVLARQYKYDEKRGMSDELYVPALSFPVIDISDKEVYFYRKNIIIPLAADMISETPEYSIMPISPLAR